MANVASEPMDNISDRSGSKTVVVGHQGIDPKLDLNATAPASDDEHAAAMVG
jgi:hypothetical protein